MILVGQYDSPYVRRVAVSLHVLELPFERNLWELQRDRSETDLETVIAPVDPADYHIDPLTFLET